MPLALPLMPNASRLISVRSVVQLYPGPLSETMIPFGGTSPSGILLEKPRPRSHGSVFSPEVERADRVLTHGRLSRSHSTSALTSSAPMNPWPRFVHR